MVPIQLFTFPFSGGSRMNGVSDGCGDWFIISTSSFTCQRMRRFLLPGTETCGLTEQRWPPQGILTLRLSKAIPTAINTVPYLSISKGNLQQSRFVLFFNQNLKNRNVDQTTPGAYLLNIWYSKNICRRWKLMQKERRKEGRQ